MTSDSRPEYLLSLVNELRRLPAETEWLEFKENNADANEIGENISALANSAALYGKPKAYVIWGVGDGTHQVVGTTFCPAITRVGNEQLENWLSRLLEPGCQFRFHSLDVEEKPIVLLEIDWASHQPIRFHGQEYLRIGSCKRKLKDFPEKERELWRVFDHTPFEAQIVAAELSVDEVLALLDYPSYFKLLGLPLPDDKYRVADAMAADQLVRRSDAGRWDVTNLGAVLFAAKLSEFHSLKRKAIRVIVYKGNSRVQTIREQVGAKGYSNGFEGLIGFVNSLLPSNEVIEMALRKTVPMYPELAVRKLVANALIHQDLFVTGAGPTIEIFEDRIEITNPGVPLIETIRFLDSPPRSRNESLASIMRRIGVCEERGSGVDKVVFQAELYQLPAPAFEIAGDNTKAILFAQRPLTRMDKEDRIRACYLHACLKFVNREHMTNTTLRERFGIEKSNKSMASRYIREAVRAGLIKLKDSEAGPKMSQYVPFWA